MTNITPFSSNEEKPIPEPKPERQWFNAEEINKLKPIVQKIIFAKPETVTDSKIVSILQKVEGYVKKGENLPAEYEKKTINLFYRLAHLGPEKWNHVIAEIEKLGIANLNPQQMALLIQKEEASLPPAKMTTSSLKRPLEEDKEKPSPLNPPLLEKKTKKNSEEIEEEKVISTPENKPVETAHPAVVQKREEEFIKIFNTFFLREAPLKNYTWDKLKKETQELGSEIRCRTKSLLHAACWWCLHIVDNAKLDVLLHYLQTLSRVTPFLLIEAAKAIATVEIEFPGIVMGLLAASITDQNHIMDLQKIYKKNNWGLESQKFAVKVLNLFIKYSTFKHPKHLELLEAALSHISQWIANEESFLFAEFILECLLMEFSLQTPLTLETIQAVFKKAEENQKELHKFYLACSPLDKDIFRRVFKSKVKTTSLQEIRHFIQLAHEKFTFQTVSEMTSESVFRKHLCQAPDPDTAQQVARDRLRDRSLALTNGASVLVATRQEFINGLIEALQANIIYVVQLEEYARGDKNALKWPVEAPNDSLRFPHLNNLLYEFKINKNNSVFHQQSLNTPAKVEKWTQIEFGLIFDTNKRKLAIIHGSPKTG